MRDDDALIVQDEEHRKRAREHLLDLVTYCWPGYIVNWHHRLLADKLTAFARGLITRLLICVPPQTGKSTLVSRYLPAFILGRDPDTQVLSGMNTRELAGELSTDCQQIMMSAPYQAVFPDVHIGGRSERGRRARAATNKWELIGPDGPRGGYRALGRGATSAGFPARWALIDDPFRGSEEVMSAAIRRKAWRWFTDDIMNRIGAAGSICVTHTAWHPEDIRGKILEMNDEGTEEWEVVILPARLDKFEGAHPLDPRAIGDPLWEWFYAGKQRSEGMTPRQKREAAQAFLKQWEKKSAYGFASLGQQRPAPEGGRMIPIHKLRFIDSTDAERVKTVRYWDNAGTDAEENGDADFSVGAKMSLLDNDTYLIEHVARGQWDDLERERQKLFQAKRDGIGVEIYFEQEPGSAGKDQAKATARKLAGFIATADRVTGNKVDRARPFAAQVQAGNVYVLKGAWNKDMLDELEYWPNSPHKDQGDALSGAFSKLVDEDGYNLEGMAKP